MHVHVNGNAVTKLMHRLTFAELQRTHVIAPDQQPSEIAEKPILVGTRYGVYDFLLKANDGRTVGIEVLTRPSKGKLKQKLFYAQNVDEFIFVVPVNALSLYRKPMWVRPLKVRPLKFPKEFDSQRLHVWLLDLREKKFVIKNKFNEVYWVDN